MLPIHLRQSVLPFIVGALLLLSACGTPTQPETQSAPAKFGIEDVTPACSAEGVISVKLSWSAAEGADSYLIYRDGEQLHSGAATTFTDDADLTAGEEYIYRVDASNAGGTTAAPAVEVAVAAEICQEGPPEEQDPPEEEIPSEAPGAPGITQLELVACDVNGAAWIDISWSAAEGATGYSIERDSHEITSLTADVVTYRDGPISEGGTYSYRVVAENEHGRTGSEEQRLIVTKPPCNAHRTAFSVSESHVLAITADGELWTWQALPETASSAQAYEQAGTPTRVTSVSDVVSVAATRSSSFVLDAYGTVWFWPLSDLGDGSDTSPTPVELGLPFRTSTFAMGPCGALFVDWLGHVWQLDYDACNPDPDDFVFEEAEQVPDLTGVAKVALSWESFYALHENGTVSAWGANWEGQLGLGDEYDRTEPEPIPDLVDVIDIAVASTSSYALALLADGTLLSWGSNHDFQLGYDSDGETSPKQVLSNVVSMAAAQEYVLAASVDGSVQSWGRNSNLRLGFADGQRRESPEQVPGLSGVHQVFAGPEDNSFALLDDGSLVAWGSNADDEAGMLGHLDPKHRLTPVETSLPRPALGVAGGLNSGVAVLEDNSVWTWGSNRHALGRGNITPTGLPGRVTQLDDEGVISVTAGRNTAYAVTKDGELFAWGMNAIYGALGLGNTVSHTVPVQVALADVERVAAAQFHVLALTEGGEVYSWGHNAYGQLGLGHSSNSFEPVKIKLDEAIDIAVGLEHSLALLEDGTVWAWGRNTFHQLGSAGSDSDEPQQVADVRNAVAIAAFGTGSMALIDDGTVLVWGNNIGGRLGLQPDAPHGSLISTPTELTALRGAESISAGFDFGLARLGNGTVLAWGVNSDGQLAQGHTDSIVEPVEVPGGTYEAVFAVSSNRSYFSTADGTLLAAGLDTHAQLGRHRVLATAEPVPVPDLPALPAGQ